MKKVKATTIKTNFHKNIVFFYYTKKGEFMQPTFGNSGSPLAL